MQVALFDVAVPAATASAVVPVAVAAASAVVPVAVAGASAVVPVAVAGASEFRASSFAVSDPQPGGWKQPMQLVLLRLLVPGAQSTKRRQQLPSS